MDPEANVVEAEAPLVEYFGDAPESEDLSELDRGDAIEPSVEESDTEATDTEGNAAEENSGDLAEAEPDNSGESSAEEAPAAAAADDEVEEILIPKARLDTEIGKRRELEDRVSAMEAERKAAEVEEEPEEPFDYKAKVREEYEAVMEGDLDKAAEIRMEVSEYTAAQQAKQMDNVREDATTQTKAQLEFDDKVAELTEDFPTFDPDHVEFEPELLKSVLFKRDAYANAGMPVVEALEIATLEVAKLNGLSRGAVDPVVTNAKDKEKLSPADKKEIEAKVKRKLDAAAAQPPDIQGESSASRGETALHIEDMTEEEFDALPEATLKRYRGD